MIKIEAKGTNGGKILWVDIVYRQVQCVPLQMFTVRFNHNAATRVPAFQYSPINEHYRAHCILAK